MKTLSYASLLLLLTVLAIPATSDAFSRRSHHSEVGPTQATTGPLNKSTTNTTNDAQSVPEPPILFLMSIGLGMFGLAYALKRYRKQFEI